jgi:formate dehydrogenase accessory protein FdhE
MTISIARRSPAAEFERRAARAELLASEAEAAREPLLFAAALCRAQSTAALALEEANLSQPFMGRMSDDARRVVSLVTPVLGAAAASGPAELAEHARTRGAEDAETAEERLLTFWRGDANARDDYLSRALLRPYAELLRAYAIAPDRLHRSGHCPFCGGAAIVSSRKEAPDSNGALRLLHCGLCGCEWNVGRVSCLACGENDSAKLPLFNSDAHPAVRIEACETCSRYVKSIDLTVDARPIPEIDDLVSIAMDLWAVDQGLTRIEPGWAGI